MTDWLPAEYKVPFDIPKKDEVRPDQGHHNKNVPSNYQEAYYAQQRLNQQDHNRLKTSVTIGTKEFYLDLGKDSLVLTPEILTEAFKEVKVFKDFLVQARNRGFTSYSTKCQIQNNQFLNMEIILQK